MDITLLKTVMEEFFGVEFGIVEIFDLGIYDTKTLLEQNIVKATEPNNIMIIWENKKVKDFVISFPKVAIYSDQIAELLTDAFLKMGFDIGFTYEEDSLFPGHVCKVILNGKLFGFAYPTKPTMGAAIIDTMWNVMHTYYYYENTRK
jgi:hypothetical protein